MTQSPHTIGDEQPLSVAHQLTRQHRIRHLPVLHGGKLVGIEMADHRYGSAVVVDKERVVGVLTTVDGMRALSSLLSERKSQAW